MKSTRNNQSGLWDYLLLANPDERVGEKVRMEKEHFTKKFGVDVVTKTTPYIPIANFLLKERMEELLCRQIQNICSLQYSFDVALNNFSGFPPDTVFIRVQNPTPFKQLAKSLKKLDEFFTSSDCPPSQLVNHPHISIAKKLKEEIYNKAIVEYAQRDFSDVFVLNKLTLLKRESHYKSWQHVTHLHLPAERNQFN